MIESIVISFVKGGLGIVLGLIASGLTAKFGDWPVVISVSSILLSFLFHRGWAFSLAGIRPEKQRILIQLMPYNMSD